jgi:restriction system protein
MLYSDFIETFCLVEGERAMARHSGFMYAIRQAQRDAERYRNTQIKAQQNAQSEAVKKAARLQKDYEKAEKADQKERARLYSESRMAQVDVQNEQLEQDVIRLNNLLIEALTKDPYLDLNTLKQPPNLPIFSQGELLVVTTPPPPISSYIPPEPTGFQKLLPGAKEKHAQQVVQAQALYNSHFYAYSQREAERQRRLAEAQKAHERQVSEARQRVAAQHAEINDFQKALAANSPSAIVNYFTMVLEASDYPEGFPQSAKVA